MTLPPAGDLASGAFLVVPHFTGWTAPPRFARALWNRGKADSTRIETIDLPSQETSFATCSHPCFLSFRVVRGT